MNRSLPVFAAAILVSSALVGGAFAQIKTRLPNPGDAPAGSPVATYGWLQAKDGFLRGSKTGTTNIQLKGMSFGWSNGGDMAPFWNENTVAWFAHDWKVDVLRAAVGTTSKEMANPGYCDGDEGGQERIARVVIEAAIKRGIYIIIDFHSHTATEQTACATKFFKTMVESYGKYPNVIYEIFNEPTGNDWGGIRTYSNTIISAIRSAESSAGATNPNLILIGNPQWSSQPNVSGDVTDSKNNVAYTLHFYSATGAHDGYRGNATGAKSAGRTVFVSESSVSAADGNGGVNTGNYDTWLTGTLDPNKMSWVFWHISNKDESSAILKPSVLGTTGSWSDASYSAGGTYVRGKFPKGNATYTVTLTQPAVGGSISKSPNTSAHAYNDGVTITAVPDAGWELLAWTGDAGGNNNNLAGTIIGVNWDISAEFYNCGLLKNGHFTYTLEPWVSNNKSSLVVTQDDGQLKAVSSAGTAVGDLRVTQSGIKLEKGRKYELRFKARGQSARSVTPRITNSSSTRDYMGNTPVTLSATAQEFTKEFNSDTSISNAVLRFDCGGDATAWYLDDVKLLDKGPGTAAVPRPVAAVRTAWSIAGVGGVATLRGPADVGATLSLYDARGKTVRSFAAVNGLTLSKGIPVGNYIAVIRNASGREVYRNKVSITR